MFADKYIGNNIARVSYTCYNLSGMRQSETPDSAPGSKRNQSAAIRLIIDMANTTWRMFVPIVGLLLFGRYLDTMTGTKPLLMLVGAACGTLVAALLIKSQLKKDS